MGKFFVAGQFGRGPRRCRRAARRLRLEFLEPRLLLATLVVNTTVDDTTPDDMLTLREAIELTNGSLAFSALSAPEQILVSGDLAAANTIDFDIPATSIPVIQPTSSLPEITSPVTIDGTSQPGIPFVALAGNLAGDGVNGLTISAGDSVVKGLIIGLFHGSGIVLKSVGGNRVSTCFIGTDLANDAVGNGVDGITIDNSPNNSIGGTDPGAGNVISGNAGFGIAIVNSNATGNTVQGNGIGTDFTAEGALPNVMGGIEIKQQASNNLIGGGTPGGRNFISGNQNDGILIADSASGNRVQGNFIGTNFEGNRPVMGLPLNAGDGVTIIDASGNTIGGTDPGLGNVISGNGTNGINIFSSTDKTTTTGNVVQGNRIGSDASGTAGLANANQGVLIANAQGNTIGGAATGAGNVISANQHNGIELASAATGNVIQGNKIGTDTTGTKVLSNLDDGMLIVGASSNTIGGTTPAAGNIISFNHQNGIHLIGNAEGQTVDAANNLIQGNEIGTDLTGTLFQGNGDSGVLIEGASSNTIGGATPAARNIISGNDGDGVTITKFSAADVVQGNYIGLDSSGRKSLANSDNGVTVATSMEVTIGGSATGAGNLIAGNKKDGIAIELDSSGTLVQGNSIGLDVTGANFIMNSGNGVSVDQSTGTTIGGTSSGARNVISSSGEDGIKITNSSDGATVQGNFIGTDVTGTALLANLGNGVEVTILAQSVTIGGATSAARNIISGNQGSGIVLSIGSGVGNTVQGNFIGTDVSGTQAMGNKLYGVLISQSQANIIGGATPSSVNVVSAEQNLIAGNHLAGVFILGKLATGNTVLGNLIGTDVSGAVALANEQGGVSIGSAATGNTIGGTTPAAGNVISGNLTNGVTIAGQGTSGNTVEGNRIGTDATGLHPLKNFLSGIFIQDASGNTVGGTTLSAANLISGNGQDGIAINNSGATGNLIEGNAIGTDITTERALSNGGNGIAIIGAPMNTVMLNVISGNSGNGISIANLAAGVGQGISIIGNVIGTNLSNVPLGNGGDGILLDTVTNEVIGGLAASARNTISANQQAGIEIRGSGSGGNRVEGNYLGTTLSGAAPLGNAIGVNVNGVPGNTIEFNLISGNSLLQGGGVGVQILGAGAAGNLVLGNFIGSNSTGTQPVANDIGVFVNGAPGNSIVLNVVSGNIRPDTSGIGIEISGTGASNNLVQSNKIGTDQTATRTLVAARADLGILLNDTPGNNLIGGTGTGDGNVISGFKVAIEIFAAQSEFNPTPGSTVQGNMIGTDQTGAVVLGNDVGIYINGVPRNLIGGTSPGAANVISGNTIGIYLLGSTTKNNQIQGNLIGLDSAGTLPLGNYIGVYLDGASANTIGGTTPGARNVIAGNKRNGADGSTGVYVFNKALNNLIQNNFIGTTISGRSGKGLGMGAYGVLFFNAPNNNVVRSGKGKNKIVGSGIAAFREFTGSTSRRRAPISGTKVAAVSTSVHVPQGPGRFLRVTAARAKHAIHHF